MSENVSDTDNTENTENTENTDNSENTEKEESFADLFEAYSQGMNQDIQVGDKIRGPVIAIGQDTVFVDTGSKIDGAVDKSELLDENGMVTCNTGDILELYAVAVNENEIKLSRALSGIGGLNMLQDAFNESLPVEGKVIEPCKGGFHVTIMQRRAFCPISQMDIAYIETPEDYTGAIFHFLITRFEESGRNIVVSRRKLLTIELEKARAKFYESLAVGNIYEGTVTRLMPYGAFVALDEGVEGMVHISEISWSRLETPEQTLAVDDTVQVKVIGIEKGTKPGQFKIALSIKQVDGDPWENVSDRFKAGEKVSGRVTRCRDFGVFVEIAPGIEGLVHISEITYKKRILKPEEVVNTGDTVSVLIRELDPQRRRISLSMRDVEGDPWLEVEEKYQAGQSITGTVDKKENFGYFITLEPGITGLLPATVIKRSANANRLEKLKAGDIVTVTIAQINSADRRISLTPGDETNEGDWKKFVSTSSGSLGSLGEKLQRAMQVKKKK